MIPEMDLGGVFCCFCYIFFLFFFANGMELNGMELSFAFYSCSCSFLSLSLSLSRFLLASRDWGNWILEMGEVGGGGGYWIWGVSE